MTNFSSLERKVTTMVSVSSGSQVGEEEQDLANQRGALWSRDRMPCSDWSPGHVEHDGLQLQPQLGLGPGLELGPRHGAGRPRHQVRELGHAAAASHQHHVARGAGLGGAGEGLQIL